MKLTPLEERCALKRGIKFRPYQRPVVARAIRQEQFGFILEPRLGKTICDIAHTGFYWRRRRIRRWLIVAPVIAKYVWLDHIESASAMPTKISVIEGKKDDKKELVKLWTPHVRKVSILITNPESMWRLRKELLRWKPDKVTIDESHRIKHRGSRQARMAHSFGRKVEIRTILTGTFYNKPTDVFSQFKFLKPEIFGTDWKSFCNAYVKSWGYGGYQPRKYKDLDDLWDRAAPFIEVLTRAEAGGFPKEQTESIYFDLTSPAAAHYAKMEAELYTLVEDQEVRADIVLTQRLRLQQITGGFLPVHRPDADLKTNVPLGDDKLRALVGVIEEYEPTEPLVVFAYFRYELERIRESLVKLGRRVGTIAGASGFSQHADRERTRVDFQAGVLDAVVVQIRAAIAISLARARTAIYYSGTSSLIDYDQSRARIADQGAGSIALIHLLARGTVDEDQLVALRERVDIVKQMRKRLRETAVSR